MANRAELDETIAMVEDVGGKMLGSAADARDFARLNAAMSAGVRHSAARHRCANEGPPLRRSELTIQEDLEQRTSVLDVNLVGAFHTRRQ